MLAILNYDKTKTPPFTARTAEASLARSFALPIELSGISMSLNGTACGIRSVGPNEIVFVVPPGIQGTGAGRSLPLIINNNGVEIRSNVAIVAARPDIFTDLPEPGPFGRARISNVTNRVHTTEPFTVTTVRIKGSRRVASRLRMRITGAGNNSTAIFAIRIGSVTIPPSSVVGGATLEAPGVYTLDFDIPPELNGAGDQPVILTINADSVPFLSRLDDTAPRVFIL
ncbi:MAG: hypothetical protein IPM25_01360 [Chloracidobacterium sp.]|nr:hypothetical protein [Chloracidobacterium sp.]